MTSEEVFEGVRDVLIDALGVDEEEIILTARLGLDLGAESIDFLDIQFRLERKFPIRIPRGHLFLEDIRSDENFVEDSLYLWTSAITPAGVAKLREYPILGDSPVLDQAEPNFGDLFTVEALCRYVEHKLQGEES